MKYQSSIIGQHIHQYFNVVTTATTSVGSRGYLRGPRRGQPFLHSVVPKQKSFPRFFGTRTLEKDSQQEQHFLYNRNLVQSRDYESYVIGLLHPPAIQPSYFALRALHVELASIQAKDTAVAAMRMKWWLDALQTLTSSSYNDDDDDADADQRSAALRGNPTLLGLEHAIQSHNLSHRFLERIVETRLADLEGGNQQGRFDNLQDMILFFERTHSTLLFLNLECCGVVDEEADKVAHCIGISTGIVNTIRSIGYGHVGIPRDLVAKHGINEGYINDPRRLIHGEDPHGRRAIRDAVMDMAMIAGDYLAHARSHQGNIPREGKCAMLPAVSCLRYLERLERLDYDVFEDKIREIEHRDTLTARWWRFGHLMYLARAHVTGVF
jgi:NADH dehydrogenase [ubiquinone] 1 alpha subcomplex assembly factor 6